MKTSSTAAIAMAFTSALISLLTLTFSVPGVHGRSYLYYHSSYSTDASRRTGSASSNPVLPGLYAAEIDHRRRITIPPDNGDKRPSLVEIGSPIRVQPPKLTVCNTSKNDLATDQRRLVTVATKSMSIDDVTGRALWHTRRRPEDVSFSLLSVSLCPLQKTDPDGEAECVDKASADGNGNAKRDDVVKIFDNAQVQPSTYKITSFAMYDDIIYFILEHTDRVDSHSKTSTIELRRLLYPPTAARSSAAAASSSSANGYDKANTVDDVTNDNVDRCAELFKSTVTRESYFNAVECSELLSVVSRETFQKFSSYQPLEGLLVLPAYEGGLNIYLQLQRLTYDPSYKNLIALDVILYHVHLPADDAVLRSRWSRIKVPEQETFSADSVSYSTSSSEPHLATPIHTTSLQSFDYIRYILYQRGALSARRNTLCWSAVDRVLCGRLNTSGSVSDVKTVLDPALVATVCTGSDVLASVVSGIALTENTDLRNLAFYFGCVAETPGMGGAGLFVGGTNSPPAVYRLHSNFSDVRGESMFITTSSKTCPPDVVKAPAYPVRSSGFGMCSSTGWSSLHTVLAFVLFLTYYCR